MRNKLRFRGYLAVAAGMSGVLALSACNSGGGGGSSAEGGDDSITVLGCDPETALLPASTNSVCGLNVLNAVTARLVHYADDGEAVNDLAESIVTEDSRTWQITIKENQKFSDGTPIVAHSFVDAWNWAAYGPHNQINAPYFARIAGYQAVHPADPDGDGLQQAPTPTVDVMSGLNPVDDRTFTVTLTKADSTFPQRLGLITFAPLPSSFFDDDGHDFGAEPIGAGPFLFDEYTKGQSLVLKADEKYEGPSKPHVKTVIFTMYPDSETAYNDVVANTLDVTNVIPAGAREDERYKNELDSRWVGSPKGEIQLLRFPDIDEDGTYDSVRLRRAISMSLDRTELVKLSPGESLVPATGWVPPGVGGYEASRCGTTCVHDPDEADNLHDNAGGYSGTIRITYDAENPNTNAGSVWSAVCREINDALNEPCSVNGVPSAQFHRLAIDDNTTDMLAIDRMMSYPSIEDFLYPLYSRYGSENNADYLSSTVNNALDSAAAKPSIDEGFDAYQNAEEKLVDNMPTVPLWYATTIGGYSERVENVKFDIFGLYDLSSIAVTN